MMEPSTTKPKEEEGAESVSLTEGEEAANLPKIAEPQKKEPIPAAPPVRSDKALIALILILLVIFALFFGYAYYISKKPAKTIEDLHVDNLKGKLDSDQGFVYRGVYSFVLIDDQWYTQLTSQTKESLFNFAFRYSPRDLEDFPIRGDLNTSLFNSATEYYITFNPEGENLSKTVVAVNDYNQHMLNVFKKMPIAACAQNITDACSTRPIITCENTYDQVVVYIDNLAPKGVTFDNNCIHIGGVEFDQVKGVDRALYYFYDIMPLPENPFT